MSQHPSLKSDAKGKAHRSVWKRFERLKFLADKDKWNEGNSIFGLPKMKLLKIKIKKEKPAEAEAAAAEGAAAEGAAAEATPKTKEGAAGTKPVKGAETPKGAKGEKK